MDIAIALLLRLMRRARLLFLGCYLLAAAGFLYSDPRSGWTWAIVVAGALLSLLFWALVAFWTHVFTGRAAADDAGGPTHD